jgi:hypothetical protein
MPMQKLYFSPGINTPEIHFSPDENIFMIKGRSAPEDVRAIYYPVIEHIRSFVNSIVNGEITYYNSENPLVFQVDLNYFNSSSAKFIYDIFCELKKLPPSGIPISVEWIHDEEDTDMRDAGSDIALLAGMEFIYISKKR